MANLKEEAQAYEPQRTKNIADLEVVSLDMNLEEREGTDKNGKTFRYRVTIVNGEDYRIPAVVLKQIKAILKEKPNLKKVKVAKTGEGFGTDYTVIPLM